MNSNVNQNINNLFSSLSGSLGNSFTQVPLPTNTVSYQSNKYASTTINNQNTLIKSFSYQENKNLKYRQGMEDVGTTDPSLTTDYKVSLFCIYDGHGGTDVVNFVKGRMPQLIKTNLSNMLPIDTSLLNSFSKVDDELKFYDSDFTGCTATVVLLEGSDLYCANVGDSKAFLINSTQALQISTDHKAKDPEEAKRILSSGGTITKGRVNGQLILSRTLGDLNAKKNGVISTPSISMNPITKGETKYCVIASDGVWDVVDGYMLFEMSKGVKGAEDFAKSLVKTALEKGSKDNISCIVISFI